MSLTREENEWLAQTARLWNGLCELIPEGPTRNNDLAEASVHLHALQHMVMANSAARSHPSLYRLLGNIMAKPPALLPKLSPREEDVAKLLYQGLTYMEIGRELHLEVNTIKTHVERIYQKFGVNNRARFITTFGGLGET